MNHFELIEAYISGEMNASEKAAFEVLLKQDAGVKKDFDEWLQTEAIITKHEAAATSATELINTLQPLTKEYFQAEAAQQKGRVVSFKKYVFAAMAAAAILVFFFLMPANIDNYDITPMPGAVVRGSEDVGKKGAQLFNEKKYEEALPYLKQNVETNSEDATSHFYYGIALLKVGKAGDALPVFEKLTQGSSAYKEDSYFFAALAAYKNNQKDIAAKYAAQVPENNQYYKNAQRILKKAK